MELRRVLAAAFKHHGREALTETQLVAALALERDWYEPDEVRRLMEQARAAGALTGADDALRPTFDVGEVSIPSGYEPPADLADPASPFERILARLEADGHDRRDSVAAINRLQRAAGLESDAAAVLYAHGEGLDVRTEAQRVRADLEAPP